MIKHYTLTLVLVLLFVSGFAQNKKDYRKLHYLSQEEMKMPLTNVLDFTPTDPPEGFIRNVAEFDQMQGVMVRYPFGIPISLIAEMAEDTRVLTIVKNEVEKQSVLEMYANYNVNLEHCDFLFAPTNTYWTRDYGPFYIFDGNNNAAIVDFPYNRPRPDDDNIAIAMAQYLNINLYGMNLIHTGGNYMCDGMGQAASTDLVLDENPSLSEQDVDTLVDDFLGIETYHITADPLGDYIKHIDCWGKYLAPDKIIIGQVPANDPRYDDYEAIATYFANQISSYGNHYKVYRVFTPGSPEATPYTNSLILNKKVLVPTTGNQWDEDAITAYQEAMPGYEIVPIQYGGWINTDALHCRTKGIADINQLYIWHKPILGSVDFEYGYPVTANLYNYSGQPVYEDSVFLIYQINQGNFDTVTMTSVYRDSLVYTGTIAGATPGDTVRYYLYAADESEHHANHPYIGLPDPHQFVVNEQALLFDPDTVWFQTFDQMWEGINLNIINTSDIPVTINSITQYGLSFMWYIKNEDLPDFPFILPEGDTLSFPVYTDIPVFRNLVYDTMYIETSDKTYKELMMIDSELIEKINEKGSANDVTVFPNPATSRATFKWNQPGDYTLSIFNLSGKKVYSISGNSNQAIWKIDSKIIKPGIYLYQIKIDNTISSGKIIKN
jgi:agmatine/peptidylarginine deiminase